MKKSPTCQIELVRATLVLIKKPVSPRGHLERGPTALGGQQLSFVERSVNYFLRSIWIFHFICWNESDLWKSSSVASSVMAGGSPSCSLHGAGGPVGLTGSIRRFSMETRGTACGF